MADTDHNRDAGGGDAGRSEAMGEPSPGDVIRHLQDETERERSRVARELHDGIFQTLTAARMNLGWIETALVAEGDPVQERVRAALGLVDEAIRRTRSLNAELRPPLLDFDLMAALEWEAGAFQKRLGIPCIWDASGDLPALASPVAIGIFRMFQEVLEASGSVAGHLDIRFAVTPGQLTLGVLGGEPDGSPDGSQAKVDLRLASVRVRAAGLGGVLAVQNRAGGRMIEIRLPLRGA
jgi:two-component system, NarL family, sensor histidine kinase UhpB